MPYCDNCEHLMDKKTTSNQVIFSCELCSTVVEGGPEDTLMFSDFKISNSNELFRSFKKHAAYDPCNFKVSVKCDKCTMPYMSLIRVNDQDRASLVCVCGNEKLYE